MKRLALLSTVVAITVVTLFASTAQSYSPKAQNPGFGIGVMYDRFELESEGILYVANAEGDFVEVFTATGELVWFGVVPAANFEFPCPNSGEGVDGELLRVFTSSGAQFCIDRDEDWIWD